MLHRTFTSRPHLSVAIAAGLVAGLMLPASIAPMTRALIGWNLAVWSYLTAMGWVVARSSPPRVDAIAASQDERAGLVLAVLVVAAIMSITAITTGLPAVPRLPPAERGMHYAFAVLTLLGSWFLVGALFCFHYAHLYYNAPEDQRPLGFPLAHTEPDYVDFLYFSFAISVAMQTSDVRVLTHRLRKIVLAQSVLCFFFNLAILGLSVNIAAALLRP